MTYRQFVVAHMKENSGFSLIEATKNIKRYGLWDQYKKRNPSAAKKASSKKKKASSKKKKKASKKKKKASSKKKKKPETRVCSTQTTVGDLEKRLCKLLDMSQTTTASRGLCKQNTHEATSKKGTKFTRRSCKYIGKSSGKKKPSKHDMICGLPAHYGPPDKDTFPDNDNRRRLTAYKGKDVVIGGRRGCAYRARGLTAEYSDQFCTAGTKKVTRKLKDGGTKTYSRRTCDDKIPSTDGEIMDMLTNRYELSVAQAKQCMKDAACVKKYVEGKRLTKKLFNKMVVDRYPLPNSNKVHSWTSFAQEYASQQGVTYGTALRLAGADWKKYKSENGIK